jgi:hypothetical protein
MTKKKTAANKVARAAAAAAAAAVNASQQEDTDKVLLSWGGDDDDDDEEVTDEVLEGLEQVDEESAGGLVWWELYCESPLEKKGQIRKMATQELRGLRDECLALGPGEYTVVARHKKGTFIKGSRRRIKISGFARPAAAAAAASTFDPMVFMQQMEERAERRRMEERVSRNAQIKFWAPILAPIGLEFAKGLFNRGGGEPLKDLVAALVGMKDLSGAGKSHDVENLLKGIELARDLNPGDAKGSTWPDVIGTGVTSIVRELRPLAEQLAARRNGAAPAPAGTPQLQFQTQPAAAAAAPTAPSAAASGEPPSAGDPMLAMIEPLLRKLAGELEDFAVNNADPGLTAEALLAKIPPLLRSQVQPAQLKEWLTQPNWWPLLVSFQASLQHYQAYCNDVRLALLETVEEMINPPPPAEESADD